MATSSHSKCYLVHNHCQQSRMADNEAQANLNEQTVSRPNRNLTYKLSFLFQDWEQGRATHH